MKAVYDINLESYFLDECDSLWDLSTNYQFMIDDCPLVVDIVLSEDSTICFGECIDIYANVSGGDSNSYNFFGILHFQIVLVLILSAQMLILFILF